MAKPQKNGHLSWARENAELTQKEAAGLLDVTQRTFSRWETGVVQIPKRKWSKFLQLIKLDAAEIPKHREYDADGYPTDFDRTPYDGDSDAEETALAKIEEAEHPARARERYRLELGTLHTPESLAREMADYDKRHGRTDDGEDLAG